MEYPIKTVCVVGLGYIGLPTVATLASRGIEVIGADINPRVVEAVNAGQPYFSEPHLDMLLRAATTLGKLRAHAGAGARRCIHHRRANAVSRKSTP
jgi:UDP-N-acetyl-D-mannosaminuronic acid dehydrogenase